MIIIQRILDPVSKTALEEEEKRECRRYTRRRRRWWRIYCNKVCISPYY